MRIHTALQEAARVEAQETGTQGTGNLWTIEALGLGRHCQALYCAQVQFSGQAASVATEGQQYLWDSSGSMGTDERGQERQKESW